MKTGTLGEDGRVTWLETTQYDTGGYPSFAVEQRSGRAMEVHQGALGAGGLWSHDGDVYRAIDASGIANEAVRGSSLP